MPDLAHVEVKLDDNVPDYMDGIIRAGSIISFDEHGNEIQDHQNLIDNSEYHSEEELVSNIAETLSVEDYQIEIVG